MFFLKKEKMTMNDDFVKLYRTHEKACEQLMLSMFEHNGDMWLPRGRVIRFLVLNRKFTSLLKKVAASDPRPHIRMIRAPRQARQSFVCGKCIP